MHLLYVDESGAVSDPKQIFFILAGVSLHETQCHWMSNELDKIAARFNPADPLSVELHGSPMLKGRGIWRQIPLHDRVNAIKDALSVLANSHYGNRISVSAIVFIQNTSLFKRYSSIEIPSFVSSKYILYIV